MSCDGDDGDCPQRRIGFEATCSLVSVYPREPDIHENEIWSMRGGRGKSRFSVHRFNNLKISAREQIPQDLPIVLLILDHQDALAHG
jgi:hypothetical protein